MHSPSFSVKTFIAERTTAIAAGHRAGAGGFATCTSLTMMMDEALTLAYNQLFSQPQHIAVLALGGYGRAELSPESDVDVMILAEDGENKEEAEQFAKSFLQQLWDAGINVGHSVRTVGDALALNGNLVDSWASMLESRFVCGSSGLAEELFGAMKTHVERDRDGWFINGVLEEIRTRHARFGNSVKLLEPHIKKSAGGLRDFHSVFWLYRGSNPLYCFPVTPHMPASMTFLDMLVANEALDEEEREEVVRALQFLLRVRHEMHFRRQSAADGLEYLLQREVAEALGFGGKAELRSVEVFMREYYLHARTIHRFHQHLSHQFREIVEPVRHNVLPAEPLGNGFFRIGDTLTVEPGIGRLREAEQVLEAFALSAELEIDLHVRVRRAISSSLDLFTDEQRCAPGTAGQFRRILNSRRVAAALREMNELDVLSSYIPEWGDLVAFFQHNMYHYYTADEHTLIAVANAEQLRERQGILREVFRLIRRKDILYLSILLHDIAKPLGVADHEVTGVAVARTVLKRLHMSEAFDDVAFLVRNHLVMEQIAFRRNIHDPATIKEFAARFQRPEQLDYLYLLTYADLSAVNTNVWTDWKSSLLLELYHLTSEILRRDLNGDQIDAFRQSRHEAAVEALVDRLSDTLPRNQVHEHISGIGSDAYVALFTDEEIEQHILRSASREIVSALFSQQEGHTEVTVIAKDSPFLLSKFCAVLAANDANIFDANIFTRNDGIVIDRFRVSDAATHGVLSATACSKIAKDLTEVMEESLDIEHLFAAHRRKWKRRQKLPANPNTRTDVQFEAHPRYTIIDVYAPDALGFLYRITEAISRLGLDIYFAKIATRVDGILDAFYVLDRNGDRITDPAHRAAVRSDILSAVKQLSEQELSGTTAQSQIPE